MIGRPTRLRTFRPSLLRVCLLATSLIGGAWIGAAIAIRGHFWSPISITAMALVALVNLATFYPRVPQALGTLALIAFHLGVATLGLALAGPGSGTALLMCLVVLLATLLVGLKAGIVAGVAIAVVFTANAAGWLSGYLPLENRSLSLDLNDAWVWLRMGLGQLLGTTILVAMVVYVIGYADRAVEQLEQSGEKLARTFRAIPDAVGLTDRVTARVLDVNEGYEKLFGWSREESVGRSAEELGVWAKSEERERALEILRREGRVQDFRAELRARDGRHFPGSVSIESTAIAERDCLVVVARDVSEELRAERALRESEERFSKAFQASANALSINDAETGRFVDVNEGFTRLFGFTREEAIGHTAIEIGMWQDPEERAPMAEAIRRQGFVRDFLVRSKNRAGELLEMLVSCNTIELNGRKHYVTVAQDMTARVRAERALRAGEELQRLLLQNAPDAIVVFDPASRRFASANQAAERLFELPESELRERSPIDLSPPTQPDGRPSEQAAVQYLEAAAAGGKPVFEWTHRTLSGRELACEIRLLRLPDPDPNRVLIRGSILDVSDRKRAEQTLRESEERFRLLVENSNEMILELKLDGTVTYASPNHSTITGRRPEELVSLKMSELIHPDDRQRFEAALDARGGTWVLRMRFSDDSWHFLECSARAFRLRDQGERLVVVSRDISERVLAEETRRALEEQLRQAQKLDALGTLAGGIAHDFNNMLAAIGAFSELAMLEASNPSAVREHLGEVMVASDRAAGLVRRILAFSRRHEQKRAAIRLDHVVAEAFKLLRSTLPATIHMVTEFEPDPVTVMADAGQIHQVVMNLCVNAAHAIGDQPGRVVVGLGRVQVDAQLALTREGLSPGPHVRLTVEDTGSGIDEATLSRIFEPFFTTKAPGEGTGLGLAVVHGIVKDHGGTISVSSGVGVGTKFELFFPEHHAPPPEERSHAVLPRGRGEKVLFVDDEPSLCSAGGMMLERIGYRAVTFTSPAEALARFRSEPEAFDLLITDLTMPGMTGIDLARSVLELRPGLPVVLVSGFGGKWTPENVREMGIRDLVSKPVSLLLLATAVRRAIDGTTDDAG